MGLFQGKLIFGGGGGGEEGEGEFAIQNELGFTTKTAYRTEITA